MATQGQEVVLPGLLGEEVNGPNNSIGWCDYTWNPVVGCKNGCWYCYGRRIRKRFHPEIPYEQITNYDERLQEPLKLKKPSRIFVGSMTDLFAEWMPKYNVQNVLDIAQFCPQHTFQFLTKNPKRYFEFIMTGNCWLGVTITNSQEAKNIFDQWNLDMQHLKYISFEPLLGDIELPEPRYIIDSVLRRIKWIIIGAMTGPGSQKCQPKTEWIQNILTQADKYKIPVFMKGNLQKVWKGKLRREFPK